MSDDRSPPDPTPPRRKTAALPANDAAGRKARSAQALRDNLRRRKQQTAARRTPPATEP